MDLALLTKKVLQIGNQYSVKGVLIDTIKNADNLNKINNYVDTCQKELAAIRKIQAVTHYTIEVATVDVDNTLYPSKLEYTRFALPSNLMKINIIRINNVPINDYFVEGTDILINSSYIGDVALNYYKYPTTIDDSTPSTYVLELDDDVCELIPYYVAGHIFMRNDPSISTMILNEYENKRDRLIDTQNNNIGVVNITNVWGGFNGL